MSEEIETPEEEIVEDETTLSELELRQELLKNQLAIKTKKNKYRDYLTSTDWIYIKGLETFDGDETTTISELQTKVIELYPDIVTTRKQYRNWLHNNKTS